VACFKHCFIIFHVNWNPCHHDVAHCQVVDGGDGCQIWRVAVNLLNTGVVDNHQEVVLQLRGWEAVRVPPTIKD
jgi:hypothetical protein